MLIGFLQKNSFLRNIIYKLGRARGKYIFQKIKSFLNKDYRILDIGVGPCNVSEILMEEGYRDYVPLDIQNLSFVDGIQPIIFDGHRIPYSDDSFDVALILTVLHHIPHQEKIIKEAKRVARKIIIMEDIYHNTFHKYVVHFFDSLFNFEFFGHPHTNLNDKGWRGVFESFGLIVHAAVYSQNCLVFDHATYHLEK